MSYYTKVSDIPSDIQVYVKAYYSVLSNKNNQLEKMMNVNQKLQYDIVDTYEQNKKIYNFINFHDNKDLNEFADALKNLYDKTDKLSSMNTTISYIKKDIEEMGTSFGLYMESHGFDMDDRSYDEEVYSFIHNNY